MANSATDLALLDHVLAHPSRCPASEPLPDIDLGGLRLGRPRGEFYRLMDEDTARVINKAVAQIQDAGAVIVDAGLPEIAKLTAQTAWVISRYETAREMPAWLARCGAGDQLRSRFYLNELRACHEGRRARVVPHGFLPVAGLFGEVRPLLAGVDSHV